MISHTHTHFITVKYCTFKPYHWSRWINFNSWHRNLTFFQQPQKQNYWLIVSQEARNLTYRNPLLMDWLFLPEILDLRDIIYPNTSIFLKLCVCFLWPEWRQQIYELHAQPAPSAHRSWCGFIELYSIFRCSFIYMRVLLILCGSWKTQCLKHFTHINTFFTHK